MGNEFLDRDKTKEREIRRDEEREEKDVLVVRRS